MPPSVVTRAYDNARSGAQYDETVLTPDGVRQHGVRRLASFYLPGDARGLEAQPLVAAGVKLPGGETRDLLICATMSNRVFAFDIGSLDDAPVWIQYLGTPVKGSKDIDQYEINDNWGILSTPVIDVERDALYCVAWVSPDRTVARAGHLVFALDLRDGHLLHPPLGLEGASYQPGGGLPQQHFKSAARKQRAALLFTAVEDAEGGIRRTVFIPAGSIQEGAHTNRGWLIAVDVDAWRIAAAWTSTAEGSGGGIWQAGAGPAADAEGFIYLMTGNGRFAPPHDLSHSFVKLRYTPALGSAAARLEPVDWFTPFTDAERTGHLDDAHAHAEADHDHPAPTNVRAHDHGDVNAMWGDMDLGSGGPVLVESSKSVIGVGKDGVAYSLKTNAMGKTTMADLGHGGSNYEDCRWVGFLTYYPGPDKQAAPANIRDLNFLFGNKTRHLHGSPLTWDSPDFGRVLANWGENGNLRLWKVDGQGALHYLGCSPEVASAESNDFGGGMPGSMCTASLEKGAGLTTVIWCCIPYGDANKFVTAGRLIAYDGSRIGTYADGAGQLIKLWDSQDWAHTFAFNKFNVPVVWGGLLFVPTYDARVLVYGTT